MAFRKLSRNDDANGVYLVLVPFVITILLTVVFIPMGGTAQIGAGIVMTPEGYGNMTTYDNKQYLADQFGGSPTYEWRWSLKLSWPDWAGRWYYVFPDGTAMEKDKYESFLDGTYSIDDDDLYDLVMSILTIDPPALKEIGIYGTMIRVVLIVSVVIGLVELIWIG